MEGHFHGTTEEGQCVGEGADNTRDILGETAEKDQCIGEETGKSTE